MDPRKATVAILYNGVKAEVQLAPYLSSFKYTDVASGSSDSISISINDRDRKWINGWFPQKGDRLQPTIETCNWERDGQKKKFPCGKFLVDDFSFKGGPIRLDLEGLALPAASGFKATERTETYESTTLKEIGQIVAARAKVALHYEAGAVAVEKVEQNNQTDCAFFGSLVEKYGLALKIYNDKLVVFDEGKYEAKAPKLILFPGYQRICGEEQRADNESPEWATFDPGWSWNTKLDQTYTGVKYQYTNSEKNRTFKVTAGGGDRILEVNDAAENLGEATAIALAALNKANRGATTMSITMMARPGLIASDCVEIKGLGKLSGKFYVEKIDHDIGSGYKMALDLRLVQPRVTEAKSASSTVS